MVILQMLVRAHLSIEVREFFPAASLLFQAKTELQAWSALSPEVRGYQRCTPFVMFISLLPIAYCDD